MSGSRGSNKLLSGSATDISTAGGHSRRGAVAIGDFELGNSPRRLWGGSPQHDTATQMANRTAAKVASSLTHFTTGTGQRFAQAIPTAEIPKFVWKEGQEAKTMSQVFSDWLEAFSRYTKAYGPIHPTAAFDDPSFLAWLEVHWNSMAETENWPRFVEQAKLSSVDWMNSNTRLGDRTRWRWTTWGAPSL